MGELPTRRLVARRRPCGVGALLRTRGRARAGCRSAPERVLGRDPSWDYFFVLVDHAIRYGFDRARGGVYTRGPVIGPATNDEKQWWAQAEMIAALTDAAAQRPDHGYDGDLLKLMEFVAAHFVDPADSVWFDTSRGRRDRGVPPQSARLAVELPRRAGAREVRERVRRLARQLDTPSRRRALPPRIAALSSWESDDSTICGSRWLMRRPTGCE